MQVIAPTVLARVVHLEHIGNDNILLTMDVAVMEADGPMARPTISIRLGDHAQEHELGISGRRSDLLIKFPFRKSDRGTLELRVVAPQPSEVVTTINLIGQEFCTTGMQNIEEREIGELILRQPVLIDDDIQQFGLTISATAVPKRDIHVKRIDYRGTVVAFFVDLKEIGRSTTDEFGVAMLGVRLPRPEDRRSLLVEAAVPHSSMRPSAQVVVRGRRDFPAEVTAIKPDDENKSQHSSEPSTVILVAKCYETILCELDINIKRNINLVGGSAFPPILTVGRAEQIYNGGYTCLVRLFCWSASDFDGRTIWASTRDTNIDFYCWPNDLVVASAIPSYYTIANVSVNARD